MKFVKALVLTLSCLALVFSVAPLLADKDDPINPPTTEGEWDVTCTYDDTDKLLSKTCTSGGSYTCDCG